MPEKPEPIELVRRNAPDGRVAFLACGTCGHTYSPDIYATGYDRGLEHARAAAIDCVMCRPDDEDGRRQRAEVSRAKKIAAARRVTDLDFCFSEDGDRCYASVEDAQDAGETGVFGATFKPYQVDIGQVVSGILEDHHENADESELIGLDALERALDDFNKRQTGGSYEMDDKRWQQIPQSRTFAMIKPDATARAIEDAMLADIQAAGFRVLAQKRQVMTRDDAEWLYREHANKAHFPDLVDYTVSGEVVMLVLEGEQDNVPAAFRALMGPTDRSKAEPHTLRAKYAVGLRENSIHGSDSPSAAIDEIARLMS